MRSSTPPRSEESAAQRTLSAGLATAQALVDTLRAAPVKTIAVGLLALTPAAGARPVLAPMGRGIRRAPGVPLPTAEPATPFVPNYPDLPALPAEWDGHDPLSPRHGDITFRLESDEPRTPRTSPMHGRRLRGYEAPANAKQVLGPEGDKAGIAHAGRGEDWRVLDAKKKIRDNISDHHVQALAVAIGGAESKFSVDEVKRDQTKNGKLGKDEEEFGIFRMNRKMLRDLGYSEDQIAKIRDGDNALASQALAKGVQTFGRTAFLLWHRGGITAYDNHKKGQSPAWDDQIYVDAVDRIQRTIELDGAYLSNKAWVWIAVPPK